MQSALSRGCRLKLENFEGPFDLLFHLIEKNRIDIYDIPINEITDQYMEYLFAMREMDMEIASEFLVMAATLLHIKSRMLLPENNKADDEEDPREELIVRLVEYKKYKDFSGKLREKESKWSRAFYKFPEFSEIEQEIEVLDLAPKLLTSIYSDILKQNREKMNNNTGRMRSILRREQVTLKSKIKEVVGIILKKGFFMFSEIFSLKKRSRTEVVTGFLAILELARMKRLKIEQKKMFSDIRVSNACEKENSGLYIPGDANGN